MEETTSTMIPTTTDNAVSTDSPTTESSTVGDDNKESTTESGEKYYFCSENMLQYKTECYVCGFS